MGGWIARASRSTIRIRLRTLTLMNNAGIMGAVESELQKLAADRDYNLLVLASLQDADRLTLPMEGSDALGGCYRTALRASTGEWKWSVFRILQK